MNRLALAAAVSLLAIRSVLAASGTDQETLMDLENRLSAAYRAGDAEFVAKTLDETYTLTNSHAAVSHRPDDLAEVRKRDPRYDVFETHDMTARVYGETGVVIGIVSLKGSSGGTAFDVDMRFTDTFVRRDGEWKMVAAQVTRIEKR